jgi:hypothetical protein
MPLARRSAAIRKLERSRMQRMHNPIVQGA